ncbi:MAG: PQQ-binding-like beta-propeller repeat protein [Acidobacteriota bacterium]
MNPRADRTPASFRADMVVLAMALLIQCLLAASLTAAEKNTTPPAWTLKGKERVLWVLNADSGTISPRAEVESMRSVCRVFGMSSPYEIRPSGLDFSRTANGLIVALMYDGGYAVRLAAIDSETGKTRWEYGGFELGDEGGVMVVGNIILVRYWKDNLVESKSDHFRFAAVDLHDGRVLWRNGDVRETRIGVTGIPQQRVILARTIPSLWRSSELYAIDMDTGATRWHQEQSRGGTLVLPASVSSVQGMWVGQPGQDQYHQDPGNFLGNSGSDLTCVRGAFSGIHYRFVLQSFDMETGRTNWQVPGDQDGHDRVLSMAISTDRVYALMSDGLFVVNRSTGERIAVWFAKDEELTKYDNDDPKCLYLDGDMLFVHRPRGKKFQLKAVNAETGALLWETARFRDVSAGMTLVGDRVLFATGQKVTALDKRTGKEVYSQTVKFKSGIETMTPAGDRFVVLQSANQMAKYDAVDWREVYDTGVIPQKEMSKGGAAFGMLLGGALMVAAGSTGAAMTNAPLLLQSSELMAGSLGQLARTDYLQVRATGGDATFYVAKEDKKLRLLRVDRETGRKTPTSLFRDDGDVNTIVDDYRGVTCEIKKDQFTAYRFPVDEELVRNCKFVDTFGWGADCATRAASLESAGRIDGAVAEFRKATDVFNSGLAFSGGPSDEAAIRCRLGEIQLHLARLDPAQAAAYREKAESDLKRVVALASQSQDSHLKNIAERAEALLGEMQPVEPEK